MSQATHRAGLRGGRTLVPLLAALALLVLPAAASAAPPVFWQTTVSQSQPGARSVAANPDNGRLYVLDQTGQRIAVYSAWGVFERAWGWDVVDTGPGDTAADELETCVPADGDVCKPGIGGNGPGQLYDPLGGIALDSEGNVYVANVGGSGSEVSRRVQKFSPDGDFLLSFGAGVNQGGGIPSNPGDVCTAAHLANGDTCGAGTTGIGPAEFSDMSYIANRVAIDTKATATAADDDVYVGDVGRFQIFDTAGAYQDEVALPGKTVNSLAVDASGDLYATYETGLNNIAPDVHKLDPATGSELLTFAVTWPGGVALAPDGDLYALDNLGTTTVNKDNTIRRFDAAANELEAFGSDFSDGAIGLATNDVTGEGDIAIYLSSDRPSFLRAYSPNPDPAIVGPPPPVAPTIAAQWATDVGTEEATLAAQINPHFWEDATYFAQYATADCIDAGGWGAGCVTTEPGAPAPLAAGVANTPVARELALEGLAPGTAYRFRFVAQSSGGGPTTGSEASFQTFPEPIANTDCPNQDLREGPETALPDCRAWEMVSPIDTNGRDVTVYGYEGFNPSNFDFFGFDQATPGGDKLAYSTGAAFGDVLSAPSVSTYIATRGPSGWSTHAVNPPLEAPYPVAGGGEKFHAFSEDLSTGWLRTDAGPSLSAPGPTEPIYPNLYRRDNATDTYTWLQSTAADPTTCGDPSIDCETLGLDVMASELQGFSADGTEAVFAVNDLLTPEAAQIPGGDKNAPAQLYHWSEAGGVRLISRLPDGSAYEGRSSAGSRTASWIGPHLTASILPSVTFLDNAVSEDGKTVYWGPTKTSSQDGPKSGRLYVRINADQPQSAIVADECTEPAKACTLPVSEAVPSLAKTRFWGATPDGSRAIFQTEGNPSLLYAYDLAGRDTELITSGSEGVAASSDDLQRIYLASTNALTGAEQNSEGDVAQAGQPNLYLYEDGDFSFIATLDPADRHSDGGGVPAALAAVPRQHTAYATPDGSHLAFTSLASLTGADNLDTDTGNQARQVYLYVAATGELSCASCNPAGARPEAADLKNDASAPALWTAGWIPSYQRSLHERRPLSADGERLFFNSTDSLLPTDTNGAQDVYQWQAPGSGDCEAGDWNHFAASEGCVSLISSGKDPVDTEFVEASESGDDVFIRTAASLDPRDSGLVSIYDARAGGGYEVPPAPGACEGEACRGPSPAEPAQLGAGSAAFEGQGNPPADRCTPLASRARRLAAVSKRLRGRARRIAKAARRARNPRRARALNRRAARLNRAARGRSRIARKQAARAKRCRGARANTSRRAAR